MFGKLMSISDELMWKYYELLTDLSVADIRRRRDEVESGTLHPKRAKVDLAKLVVTDFHSAADAAAAAERFERRFARRELPEEVPEILVVRGQTLQQIILGHGLYTPEQPDTAEQPARVMRHGLAESGSDASRKVTQGGVRVDREKRTSPREPLELMGGSFILQVGRQIRRAVLADPGDFVVLRHGVAADPAMEPWIVWQVATEGLTQLDAYSHRPHAEARARELAAHAKTTAWSWADGRVTRLGSG
jgi:tyrosyl-tRNA synthetase